MRVCFGVFLCALLGLPAGLAQNETFTVNPGQSDVAFSLGDVLHAVHGGFKVASGSVQFDPQSPQMSGSIVVTTATGESGNSSRDKRMRAVVLESPKFPEATFSPKRSNGAIAATGDSTVTVDGVFTLHGQPHDITVPMQIHIAGNTCTAKTHFAIPYVQGGLKDPSNFLFRVGKEVDMDVTLVGSLSSGAAQ